MGELKWKEKLADLVKVVTISIPDDRWETEEFFPSDCSEGVSTLMHDHRHYEKMKSDLGASRAVARKREQIILTLKKEVRDKHQRKPRGRGGKNDPKPQPSKEVVNEETVDELDPITDDENELSARPKIAPASKKACADCLNKKLGFLFHEVCDKNKQRKAIAAMEKEKIKPLKYWVSFAAKAHRNRSFDTDLYEARHCQMCMAFDINPEFAQKHRADHCLYTYNGPIQKHLGMSFKKMVNCSKSVLNKARKAVWLKEAKKREQWKANNPKRKNRVQMSNVRADPEGENTPKKAKIAPKSEPTFHEVRFAALKNFGEEEGNTLEILTKVRQHLASDSDALVTIRRDIVSQDYSELLEGVRTIDWVELPQEFVLEKLVRTVFDEEEPAPRIIPISLKEPSEITRSDICFGTLPEGAMGVVKNKLVCENDTLLRWRRFIHTSLAKWEGVDPTDLSTVKAFILKATAKPCRMEVDKTIIALAVDRCHVHNLRNELETIALAEKGLCHEDMKLYERTMVDGDLHRSIFKIHSDQTRVSKARRLLWDEHQAECKVLNRLGRLRTVARQKADGTYKKKPKPSSRYRKPRGM